MGFLTDDEINQLIPAEMLPHTTPIPTQIVSSDEYMPPPQSAKQKEVEARSNLRYGYARRPEASAG